MKRILILEDDNFIGGDKCLGNTKPSVINNEQEYDDIFTCDTDRFICLKARNNRCGVYSNEEFIKYISGC